MGTTTRAARTITRILSSSSSFMCSPKHPSLLPSLLLRRPLSILSSTMAAVNSNSFAVPFIYTSSSPTHHQLTRGPATDSAASPSLNPTGVWSPPLRVSDIMNESRRCDHPCTCSSLRCSCGDQYHWLAAMYTNGVHFQTEEELFDYYVRALACVLGSQEEAKKRIYLISCGLEYGFGAELERSDAFKLESSLNAHYVWPDYCYYERKNDPNFKPATFTPLNCNHRLENIFSYHHLSKPYEKWNSDHWLVIVKQPDVGFNSGDEVDNFIVELLTKVLGSETEARESIYVIWYKLPFGFGAEIDKDASNKLKDMPVVLSVLPDYSFDVKDFCYGNGEVLRVYSSSPAQDMCFPSKGSRFNYFSPIEERSPKKYFGSRQEQVSESQDPIYCFMNSDLKMASNGWSSDCVIAKEKPSGDAATTA